MRFPADTWAIITEPADCAQATTYAGRSSDATCFSGDDDRWQWRKRSAAYLSRMVGADAVAAQANYRGRDLDWVSRHFS
ncbi:MAG: hypothetical protein WKF30_13210 [Pyrinomonadaceae bacterium]